MAKTKISEYSATPGNNTDINNIDIAEGCSPSGINNAIRELMSDLKDWQAGNVSGQAMAVVSGGTGAETATDARTNLSAAKSGANTDITSLGGLTTPISVAQGGTGYVSTRDITYVTVASNVVTIETSVAHGFVVNDIVAVTAVTNTNVNGTGFTIASVPSTTTFTYAKTATNYARTADTGSVVSSSYLTVANMSGVVPVIHGGTGASSITANSVILGNGTSAIQEVAPSTSGNVLTSNGTTWTSAANNKLTVATAQASTSGTSIDFTSIPSWVKRITVMFNGVSTNATYSSANNLIQIQLGTSSGIDATSYVGGAVRLDGGLATYSYSTGFAESNQFTSATDARYGSFVIQNIAGNTWVESHSLVVTDVSVGSGSKALSGTLTQLRITTVGGTDTFDAGTINIMYE